MPKIKHTPETAAPAGGGDTWADFTTPASHRREDTRAQNRYDRRMLAATATCTLMVAWPAIGVLRAGKPVHSLAGLLGLAAVVLIGVVLVAPDTVGRPVLTSDADGLTVAAACTQRALFLAGMICGALAMILVGYLQFRGQISWDSYRGHHGHHSRRGAAAAALMPVLLPVIGALSLPYLFLLLHDLAALDQPQVFIQLRRDGLLLSYRENKQRLLAWEDIADLPGGYRHRGMRVYKLRIVRRAGRTLEAPLVAAGSHSVPVNALLRFYWENPQLRGELADGTAARRFAAGQFPRAAR